jgi:DNA mismatch endonuclease (patch repair protein)
MPNSNYETDEKTRQRMQKVARQNTPIERIVRSVLHRLGYRFSLRRKDLAGKPDLVLPKYRTVVFVHGCFWHGHESCTKGTLRPKRNSELWERKIRWNVEKDARVTRELEEQSWHVIVVWECETKDRVGLGNRLSAELTALRTKS